MWTFLCCIKLNFLSVIMKIHERLLSLKFVRLMSSCSTYTLTVSLSYLRFKIRIVSLKFEFISM